MLRRTKIVATLGPATDRDNNLEKIINAGANVVRLNFSHGTSEDHIRRAQEVRSISKKLNKHIAILGDLQGPKIRVASFKDEKVYLALGQNFTIDPDWPTQAGTNDCVGTDYKQLPKDVKVNDLLLLDDGNVQLQVQEINGNQVITTVTVAGPLSNNKGINKKGGGLSAPALTEKDKQDIKTAAQIDVDFLAVSFPRNGEDLNIARKLAVEAGCNAKIVAKIERAETVANDAAMEDIILASDVVMVARGDLGVEIGDAQLMGVQKKLIRMARHLNRVVITATQMMESMINSPQPTRAEVMDVANAVLDGTDAVMLSAETSIGQFPERTVKAMAEVCLGAEKHPSINVSRHRLNDNFDSIDEALAMSTMYAANHLTGVKAIVALTHSGTTPLLLSRISSGLPIFSLSSEHKTLCWSNLYRGVNPIYFTSDPSTHITTICRNALSTLKSANHINSGDLALLTHGDIMDQAGCTNTSKILTVE